MSRKYTEESIFQLVDALKGMLDEFGLEHSKKYIRNRDCNRCLLIMRSHEALEQMGKGA